MRAPIREIALNSTDVKALIGAGTINDPFRLYPFGDAPQDVVRPYVVWQVISGSPENYLNSRPDADSYVIQVDIYGTTAASVVSVTNALNYALETASHITRWGSESRDAQTKNYRFDFDVEFITER